MCQKIGKSSHHENIPNTIETEKSKERNKTTHFDRNYFLSDSECPRTEDPHRNFGSPKQTAVIGLFFFSRICLGLPKFRGGSSEWGHSESERK